MARTVGIGIQSFEEIREYECFYVDKTDFIKSWWESRDKVTLIARPRRFGKTLNMSMLECFFSVKYAGRGDLFEGLSVWQEKEYKKLQGSYPVIFISFANIKEPDYEKTAYRICQILMKEYEKNSFIINSNILSPGEQEYFDKMRYAMDELNAPMALYQLCDYLERYYGKKVILLLDEYDTPLQEAWVHGYWDEMISFIRSLFNSTFKTNPYLERAIMTGITRVSRESVFSDLNHLRVVTATSDKYATDFGFTEKEVFAALEECGRGDKKEKVKKWYDGFIFGSHADIYNPWSIINFLAEGQFKAYWVNTSSNGLAGKLIREGNTEIKEKFSKLLMGEVLVTPIDEQIVYNQLRGNEKAIWSLLVAAGYLKVLKAEEYEEDEEELCMEPDYHLALTNREIKIAFHNLVRSWFDDTEGNYNGFVKSMLQGDVKAMNVYMNRVIRDVFSYFDTGGKEPERFYHGFTLGLMVELQREYILTSNRESGFGRYDVMLEPKKGSERDAIILEFKVQDEEEEDSLKDTVTAALKQIEEKEYAASLVARGIAQERIRSYGIAFCGKEVLIGRGLTTE